MAKTPTDNREQDTLRLVRRDRLSVAQKLLLRLAIINGLVLLVILIFYFDRAGLQDNIDGHVSLTDVIYFTFITITTVGYGDIIPVTDQARMIDAFLITPIRLTIWMLFVGTAYQFLFQNLYQKVAMTLFAHQLQQHVIVCGFGYKGRSAVRELKALGYTNKQIVVIDSNQERINAAADLDIAAIVGDCTQDAVLMAARVDSARAMLMCLTRDDSTTLAVLSAHCLNPKLRILATVREEENIVSVERAGAQIVLAQQRIGGFMLAAGIESDFVVPVLVELGSARGRMHVEDAAPEPDEVGKSIGAVSRGLVLGLWRERSFIDFESARSLLIAPDDRLILVVKNR